MQKARIRTKWRDKNKQVSLVETAVAVSAVVWRIALNAAKNLHEQDFVYDNDEQRLEVMSEYVYFLTHVVDRETYDKLNADQRQTFIATLASECERHLRQNRAEILPGSEYKDFAKQFNKRSSDYAQTQYAQNTPGYDMVRTFGDAVLNVMGESQTNKWVIDQIMEIDGPEANDILQKALRTLIKGCDEFENSNSP